MKKFKIVESLLMNLPVSLTMSFVAQWVNTFFCVIMTAVMHWFTACLLGGLPLSSIPGGFLEMIGPVWISCFIVSLITQRSPSALPNEFAANHEKLQEKADNYPEAPWAKPTACSIIESTA